MLDLAGGTLQPAVLAAAGAAFGALEQLNLEVGEVRGAARLPAAFKRLPRTLRRLAVTSNDAEVQDAAVAALPHLRLHAFELRGKPLRVRPVAWGGGAWAAGLRELRELVLEQVVDLWGTDVPGECAALLAAFAPAPVARLGLRGLCLPLDAVVGAVRAAAGTLEAADLTGAVLYSEVRRADLWAAVAGAAGLRELRVDADSLAAWEELHGSQEDPDLGLVPARPPLPTGVRRLVMRGYVRMVDGWPAGCRVVLACEHVCHYPLPEGVTWALPWLRPDSDVEEGILEMEGVARHVPGASEAARYRGLVLPDEDDPDADDGAVEAAVRAVPHAAVLVEASSGHRGDRMVRRLGTLAALLRAGANGSAARPLAALRTLYVARVHVFTEAARREVLAALAQVCAAGREQRLCVRLLPGREYDLGHKWSDVAELRELARAAGGDAAQVCRGADNC